MCRLTHFGIPLDGILVENQVFEGNFLMNQNLSFTIEYPQGCMRLIEVYQAEVKVHEDWRFDPEWVRKDLHFLYSTYLEEVLMMGKAA